MFQLASVKCFMWCCDVHSRIYVKKKPRSAKVNAHWVTWIDPGTTCCPGWPPGQLDLPQLFQVFGAVSCASLNHQWRGQTCGSGWFAVAFWMMSTSPLDTWGMYVKDIVNTIPANKPQRCSCQVFCFATSSLPVLQWCYVVNPRFLLKAKNMHVLLHFVCPR